MRVLFGLRTDGADGYYRGVAPASVMRYSGYEVEARMPSAEDADTFDVLVLLRHADPVAELIAMEFRAKGKKVVYDCDDWLFGIPPSASFYEDYYQRGTVRSTARLIHHERLLRLADLVTVTTPALADKLSQYNENIEVLPNCILWCDWDILPPMKKLVEGPVIGWFGLPYHWDSWKEIAPYIERVVRAFDAHLVILGYPEVVHLFSDELAERTIVQPLVPFKKFNTMRRMIGTFDVGLAWLSKKPAYNLYKSPLRVLQYGAAGVPVVASQTVYGKVLAAMAMSMPIAPVAWVCDSPEDLPDAIAEVLNEPELAMDVADRWRQRVFTHHSYEMCWKDWLNALEGVLDA